MRWIYLHGFASSPNTTKGRWLAAALKDYGVALERPDLNRPSFRFLSLSAAILAACDLVRRDDAPVTLVGSSLGGQIAAHVAARHPQQIARMVLLAPSFDFAANRARAMGAAGIAAWRTQGHTPFFNYALSTEEPVHYGLFADAAAYPAAALRITTPTLLIHGRQDETVPVEQSSAMAERHPAITLHLIDADHALTAALPTLWSLIAAWVGLNAPKPGP